MTIANVALAAGILKITDNIAVATSVEAAEKVFRLEEEQDDSALSEMVRSGEAVLLTKGQLLVVDPYAPRASGFLVVHVRGRSQMLYIDLPDLERATNLMASDSTPRTKAKESPGDAMYDQGMNYESNGDYALALQCYQRAAAMGNPDARVAIARIRFKLGR